MIKSQFDFLKEYPIFAKYYKHFIRAEDYLYDSPQDACSQIVVFLEDFAKLLANNNNVRYESHAGVAKLVNDLCYRNVIDFELQKYAMVIIPNRNRALHDNVEDVEKAKESLRNAYLFCKSYIKKNLDPTITVGFYSVPIKEEIRCRKIENLGIVDSRVLTERLNSLQAICRSKDEQVEEQREENKRLSKRIEEKDKKIREIMVGAQKASSDYRLALETGAEKLAETRSELSKKDSVIAEQNETIRSLNAIVSSYKSKEEEFTVQIDAIAASGNDYLDGLNDEQKKAVLETDGYVRVIAGPGTGKTKTLVRRFVHLVVGKRIRPENILCLTFTNKAAKEMKSRISEWLGACDLSQVCTFHSFCYRIVFENADVLGINRDFVIIDSDDSTSIIESICEKMAIDTTDKQFYISNIKKSLSNFKNGKQRSVFLKMMFEHSADELEERIKTCSSAMEEICIRFVYEQKSSALLEFEDLINATSFLFYIKPEIKGAWQNKLKYIMVDEFQDVDNRQDRMCHCLAEINKNLFVVGDPNQTIYSWRLANVRCIQQFASGGPEKDITLIENYRSAPEILDAAQNLINRQSAFSYRSELPSGEAPVVFHAETLSKEAEWIADKMEELAKRGISKSEIAVLFRSSSSAQMLEFELLKRNTPYRVIGGNTFYNSKEIKVIHSYLQLVAYDNDYAFKKVIGKPTRGIGGKTINKLFDIKQEKDISFFEAMKYALENDIPNVFSNKATAKRAREFVAFIESLREDMNVKKLSSLVSDIVEKSGYMSFLSDSENEEGLKNLIELLTSIKSRELENERMGIEEISVSDYLKEIATYSSNDNKGEKDAFVLSTIHGAKGLEYQYVIICGLVEGSFPSSFKRPTGSITNEQEHLQEERRLCFVALTRAIKGVFLTYASSQNNIDQNDKLCPSRFLSEIEGRLNASSQ